MAGKFVKPSRTRRGQEREPTVEERMAFIDATPHDPALDPPAPAPQEPEAVQEEETRVLYVRIPVALHKRLKVRSIMEERHMSEIVQEMLRRELGEE